MIILSYILNWLLLIITIVCVHALDIKSLNFLKLNRAIYQRFTWIIPRCFLYRYNMMASYTSFQTTYSSFQTIYNLNTSNTLTYAVYMVFICSTFFNVRLLKNDKHLKTFVFQYLCYTCISLNHNARDL
jgi:hypothetical protein